MKQQEKQLEMYKGSSKKVTVNLSLETMEVRRQWYDIV